MFKMVVEILRQRLTAKSKRPDQSASRPARPPPAARRPPPADLITGKQSKLRSFIGLPPLKPGTTRCDCHADGPQSPFEPRDTHMLPTVSRAPGWRLTDRAANEDNALILSDADAKFDRLPVSIPAGDMVLAGSGENWRSPE
jgi:hypothetical protein